MAEQTKSPEELAAEQRQKARALRSAINVFEMKLRFIDNCTAFEEQIDSLSKYNDLPTKEEITTSDKVLDDYRKAFVEQMYDQFFVDYPEMLDFLGDKKSDNNSLNFATLGLMSYLLSSNDEDTIKKEHKESFRAYFNDVLPKYHDYLMNYIVLYKRWDLTKNNVSAFSLYVEVNNLHDELIKRHSNGNIMTSINLIIRDVTDTLVDKIVQARIIGLDNKSYSMLVSRVTNKYTALVNVLNILAKGGSNVLQLFIDTVYNEYTLGDIYRSISVVESKLSLDDEQRKELDNAKTVLNVVRNKGIGSSNSGCLAVILAIFIPVGLLALFL